VCREQENDSSLVFHPSPFDKSRKGLSVSGSDTWIIKIEVLIPCLDVRERRHVARQLNEYASHPVFPVPGRLEKLLLLVAYLQILDGPPQPQSGFEFREKSPGHPPQNWHVSLNTALPTRRSIPSAVPRQAVGV